jgi:hypothetical protein
MNQLRIEQRDAFTCVAIRQTVTLSSPLWRGGPRLSVSRSGGWPRTH